MVEISEVRRGNAGYAAQDHLGFVCVFAGATAGIGAATLKEMVVLLRSSTFFVLGREPHRYQDQLDELRTIGPTNNIVLVETQIALIQESARHVFAASGALYSQRYQREEDRREGHRLDSHWGIPSVVNHTTMCTSPAFDYLASNGSPKHIIFLHVTPGIRVHGYPADCLPYEVRRLSMVGFDLDCSDCIRMYHQIFWHGSKGIWREAYELTSDKFGVPGLFRVSRHNDVVPDNEYGFTVCIPFGNPGRVAWHN
ncbi:hypothetical protein BU23DRAFT_562519 [Bimuria novae-zelandiae CBS 107.79]|uniref:Uncharacterized protein n=1 Tax=Bimuria novae-zelandiae CBS 107.79 TaxID=1447943 RepID=A0A6A5VYY1_9PLEO|nr:hypothetical protein BU23DRAFT_562519 [Bimuria novae-zelandiae CBS 107.79]